MKKTIMIDISPILLGERMSYEELQGLSNDLRKIHDSLIPLKKQINVEAGIQTLKNFLHVKGVANNDHLIITEISFLTIDEYIELIKKEKKINPAMC